MRGKLTRRIIVAYYQSMYVRLSRFGKFKFEPVLNAITEAQRVHFRKAAHQCARVDAKPLEYVVSQFEVFDAVSDFKEKLILPMPHHLHGANAARRYKQRNDGSTYRRTEAGMICAARHSVVGSDGNYFDAKVVQKQFFRDQRRLDNLTKLLKISPEEVLRKHRMQFSPEFLSLRAVVAA